MGGAFFDYYIAIDWSAKNWPTPARPSKDAIWAWISEIRSNTVTAKYFRTREDCYNFIEKFIFDSHKNGKKVLVWFDFAFWYPSWFNNILWIDFWWCNILDLVSEKIEDEWNFNNRFEVASEINSICWKMQGPFWWHPHRREYDHLIPTKSVYPFQKWKKSVNEFRYVDKGQVSKGIQSIWKICYTASVWGQTLMWLPYLKKLKDSRIWKEIDIWPFDTGFNFKWWKTLIVEIWPWIMTIDWQFHDEIKDKAQVKTVANFMKKVDASGRMWEILWNDFDFPKWLDDIISKEEWWIFWADFNILLK